MRFSLPETDDALTIRADAEDLAHTLADDHREDHLRALRTLVAMRATDEHDVDVHHEARLILEGWLSPEERTTWLIWWKDRGAVESIIKAIVAKHIQQGAA